MQLQIPIFYTPRQAGVVFDNASTSGYQAALSSYNFTHRVGTGITNRVLIVGVSLFATGSVTGITYNGVAMSFVRADTNGIYRSEIWQLVAPATGSNTVAVTLSASLTSIANAQSYAGVDQGTPIDANNGGNGTNTPASASVTPVTAKTRVVGNLAAQSAGGVVSASAQAPRTSNAGALGTGASDDKGIIDTAASTTLTWNGIGAIDSWAVSLVALRPPTAGVHRTLTLTETLSVTEATSPYATTRILSESIAGADSILKASSKTLVETATLSDSIIKAISRILAEALTGSDTLTTVSGRGMSFTETLALTDAITKATARILAEALTGADSVTSIQGRFRTLTETITETDSLTSLLARFSTLTETLVLSDSLKKQTARIYSEVLTLTDSDPLARLIVYVYILLKKPTIVPM